MFEESDDDDYFDEDEEDDEYNEGMLFSILAYLGLRNK
jgi:hypothetical protein